MSKDEELRAVDEARRLRELLGAPTPATNEPLTPTDEALLARILAMPAAQPVRRPLYARLPVRIAAAAVLVLAVVVAGISWQSKGTSADAGLPPVLEFSDGTVADALADTLPPAHDTLTAIAASASAQPLTGGSGVQQIRSYAWYLNFDATLQTAELATTFTDLRIAPDGSVVSREVRAPSLDLHGDVIDPDHYPEGGAAAVDRLPAGTMDADYAANLPRDPVALRDAFLSFDPQCRDSAADEARCVYYSITDLYGRQVVPPDLSAAVWTVLADEPTARTLGTTQDRVGREGEAVVMHSGEQTDALRLLVIDPTTGQLLSWELVGTGLPGTVFDEPTVTSFQAITSAEWIPEKP